MESLKLVEIFGFGTKVFSKRGTILEIGGRKEKLELERL